jgi:hypothetical protein
MGSLHYVSHLKDDGGFNFYFSRKKKKRKKEKNIDVRKGKPFTHSSE